MSLFIVSSFVGEINISTLQIQLSCSYRTFFAFLALFVLLLSGIMISLIGNYAENILLRHRGEQYDQSRYAGWDVEKNLLDMMLDHIESLRYGFVLVVGLVWAIVVPLLIGPCLAGQIGSPVIIYFGTTILFTPVCALYYHRLSNHKHVQQARIKKKKFEAYLKENSD